jgi:hypothetical protein
MAFAIIASGYYPRCALDKTDGAPPGAAAVQADAVLY